MKISILLFLLSLLGTMQCVAQTADTGADAAGGVSAQPGPATGAVDTVPDSQTSGSGPDPQGAALQPATDSIQDQAPFAGEIVEGPLFEDEVLADPREEAHRRFLRLSDEERYEEALEAAREVVKLTIAEFGADAREVATPLVNLATMQMRNDDYQSAEVNYKRAIAIIEKKDSRLSADLINPLNGLGAAYNQAELYDSAVVAYERALRVNNVNEGFYNFEQIKTRDGLTESHVGLSELEEANFHQEAQLEIYQRKYGKESPEIVPGFYKLGDWYVRSGQIEAAMQAYRRADNILRDTPAGKNNPARVGALEGMARIYQTVGNQSAAASALKAALAVLDSQTELDDPSRASVLVRLGDLYTRNGKLTLAEGNYAEAWRSLSSDDRWQDLRNEYFGKPVRVSGRRLSSLRYAPNASGKPRDSLDNGYVLIRYGVRSNGRVSDVQIVESDPPGMLDKAVVNTFSRSTFRARRTDSGPVASERLMYQLDFLYSPESRPANDGDSDDRLELPQDDSDDDESGQGRLSYPGREDD